MDQGTQRELRERAGRRPRGQSHQVAPYPRIAKPSANNPIFPLLTKPEQLPALEALLSSGANPNCTDGGGRTPLMLACHYGNIPAMQALLTAGADVHQKDQIGYNAIFEADGSNNPEAVKLLQKAGSNINETDPEGTTPLMMAAGLGKTESLKALIALGANIATQDNRGCTALDHAKKFQEVFAVKILRAHTPESPARPTGTPVFKPGPEIC